MPQTCQPKAVDSVIRDENGEPKEFEVEKIHAKRWFPEKRRFYYQVEWVGYTEWTYEPVEHFAGLEEEKEFLERVGGKRRQPKQACKKKFVDPGEKEQEGMEEGLYTETPRTTISHGSTFGLGKVIVNEKALKSLECLEAMDEPRFEKDGEVEVVALVCCGNKGAELGAFVQYAVGKPNRLSATAQQEELESRLTNGDFQDGEFKCFPLSVVEERFTNALLRHQRRYIAPRTTAAEDKSRARG